MNKVKPFLFTLFALCLLPSMAHAQSNPDITFQFVFDIPDQLITSITNSGVPGDQRLFVTTHPGEVWIYDGTAVLPTPFLDLTDRVENVGEAGLLRIVFHPDYAANGRFFVNYNDEDNGILRTRVSAFTVSADPDLANDDEQILLQFEQPSVNHNGGDMHFGTDGYLYIASGDGDYDVQAQATDSLLGKILRIDVDGGGLTGDCGDVRNYGIPADNPFTADGDICGAIWHLGLRNPWRFDIDPVTNNMWIADVGDELWEEVHVAAAGVGGLNFGWPCYDALDDNGRCEIDDHTPPVHIEAHQSDDRYCSITGGYVYRGALIPALNGHYLFADWCASTYQTLSGDPADPTVTQLPMLDGGPTTFGEDINGELYIGTNWGGVSRIETSNPSPTAVHTTYAQTSTLSGMWLLVAFFILIVETQYLASFSEK